MRIKSSIIAGMIRHAENDAPLEACGYLAGRGNHAVKMYAMANMDGSPEHYTFSPEEQFRVIKDARKEGLDIVAVYHSHPRSPSVMSAEDMKLAFDKSISYVIISLEKGTADLKSYKFTKGTVEQEDIEEVKLNFYEIPELYIHELDAFEKVTKDFIEGSLAQVEYRAHRVSFGIYEQRTNGTYMVRIRCTAGGMTPAQLAVTADLAGRYGSGRIHVTTRQEVQIHDVKVDGLGPVLRELLTIGLSTRGGGGNTVRNITVPEDSGISEDEIFDVTPHSVALTSRLIRDQDSWNLPRKFKIGFASAPGHRERIIVQDLGFEAVIRDGRRGFRVFGAGGMGAKPMMAELIHDFIEEKDIYRVSTAMKRLFDKHGNRRNRYAARLRFVWKNLGRKEFLRLYNGELDQLDKDDMGLLFNEIINEGTSTALESVNGEGPEFELWKSRYVLGQKQAGLTSVLIPLSLGDISSVDALELARFLEPFGENVLRFSQAQNIVLRNIPEGLLGNVSRHVAKRYPLASGPSLSGNAVSCAGADTCRLGLCLSRNLLSAVYSELGKTGVDLDGLKDVKVRISGCPNACGQHHGADIGFFGKVSRKDDRSYPAYYIVAGQGLNSGTPVFAERLGEISARNVPLFLREILEAYAAAGGAETGFSGFIESGRNGKIRTILDKYSQVPGFDEDKNYYFDWGADEAFSIAGMGRGECAAGLFDIIDHDADLIRKNIEGLSSERDEDKIRTSLADIVFSSSRMLLVTKGIEPRGRAEVFSQFIGSFIKKGLVEEKYSGIVEMAGDGDLDGLLKERDLVVELSQAVTALYNSMDNSLRFPGEGELKTPAAKFKDLRGVKCPLNFVKVKLILETMKGGETLEIFLDNGEPIENVPRSIQNQGDEIVSRKRNGDYWSVTIKKS